MPRPQRPQAAKSARQYDAATYYFQARVDERRLPPPGVAWLETLSLAGAAVGFGGYTLHRLLWLQSLQPDCAAAWLDLSILGIATFALLAFARIEIPHKWQSATAGALLGLIFFVSVLGFALADPTNIEWLLRGDWAQHFIGWQFYRNARWAWPLGAFDTFWYPVGTAVVYTDSLPLLALPLKLISPLLPARFQYIGLWQLLNCMLQGAIAALLLRCFTRRLALQVLGAGLFVLAPVFIGRLGQDTLTTQWLLLAGFWMYFRTGDTTRALRGWLAITAVAGLVHPYLSVMVLALMGAFYLRTLRTHELDRNTALRHIGAIVAMTLLCLWLAGAFILSPDSGNVAFGVYNSNLLTWFDPQYRSRWLPTLPQAGPGQYEGIGYLGIGVLALCAIAFPLAVRRGRQPAIAQVLLWPVLLTVSALTLFAFSTRITLGDYVLLDITPKHLPLLGTFRGSGRFIWSSAYLITLFGVAVVARRAGRAAAPLLALAFLVQLYELAPMHVRDAQMRIGIHSRPKEPVLHDAFWNSAVNGLRHITLVPPPACGKEAAPYFPFSLLAADHGLTINTGYLARFDEQRTFAYCDVLAAQLNQGERGDDTLYIVSAEKLDQFRATSAVPLDCHNVEGYTACRTARNPN